MNLANALAKSASVAFIRDMEPRPDKLRLLETLVDELLKDKPQEHIVADCMSAAGLVDTKDPIDRINKVLLALHFEEKDKEILE